MTLNAFCVFGSVLQFINNPYQTLGVVNPNIFRKLREVREGQIHISYMNISEKCATFMHDEFALALKIKYPISENVSIDDWYSAVYHLTMLTSFHLMFIILLHLLDLAKSSHHILSGSRLLKWRIDWQMGWYVYHFQWLYMPWHITSNKA